jgi:DNA polymerase III alpha subunit
MRRLLRQVAPRSFLDLVHAIALLRPAAAGGKDLYLRRCHGQEPPRYTHPALEPSTRDTFGILLTDDDCLSAIEALTGLPAGEADHLRRRLVDPETSDVAAPAFLAACEKNTVPRGAAEDVLTQLRRFKGYALCKAHAVSLAHIAWQEVCLKAHHPVAFWTAAFNHHAGSYPQRVHVEAAKRAGITLFLPCINRSRREFTVETAGVRTGLGAVRTLSEPTLRSILDERDKGGPFANVKDLRSRTSLAPQDVAALIRSGALDGFGQGRQALLRECDVLKVSRTQPVRLDDEPWPGDGRHPLLAQWKEEWDLLGFFAGGLPLMHLMRSSLPWDLSDSRALPDLVNEDVRIAGFLVLTAEDEGASPYLTLEDEWGLIEVLLVGGLPQNFGSLVIAEGKVEEQYGVPVLLAKKVQRPLPTTASRTVQRQRLREPRHGEVSGGAKGEADRATANGVAAP